jgi:ABC-type dipeptide/oligopeptide/nickel transport system ATPase component
MSIAAGGPILEVRNLSTSFFTDDGEVKAVRDVSFTVNAGETVGIVGESGCGKSVTALSILGLVQRPGRVVGGEILFQGLDLLTIDPAELRQIRGRDVAMIFQDPLSSLNPVLRIGFQVDEAMRAHNVVAREEVHARTIDLLRRVRVPDAVRRVRDYPHQFSGGMRQRAMIAMGLSNRPSLIIADEPTTALDVTVQAQILELLRDLNRETGTSIILITHNLGVVAGLCTRVIVMYAGQIVEEGSVEQIFESPQHPYTWSLLRSLPRIDADRHERLTSIEASPRPHRPTPRLRLPPPLPVSRRAVLRGGARAHRDGAAPDGALLGDHAPRLRGDGSRLHHRHPAGGGERGAPADRRACRAGGRGRSGGAEPGRTGRAVDARPRGRGDRPRHAPRRGGRRRDRRAVTGRRART